MKGKLFLIFIILFTLALVFYFWVTKNIHNRFIIENNEIWETSFLSKTQITDDGFEKSDLKISPGHTKIGYLKHLYSKPVYKGKEYFENYFSLIVYDLKNKKQKEVFKSDYHLSGWDWISDNEIVVYYGCGTECEGVYKIDLKTGKEISFNYGVNYNWSPDKKYVVAHHYATGYYGITVGDKFGNILFEFKRKLPNVYSDLTNQTRARFTKDGKLVLIIKKEKEEKLEKIVFDVKKDFEIISQEDLKSE